MGEEVEHESLLWNDDELWAFPVVPMEENGGKMLIEGGKILMGVGVGVAEKVMNDEVEAKGKNKKKMVVAGSGSKRGQQGHERGKGGGGGGSGESDDHELHIWTERERRKKMRNMFATLHALIPHLHPRADKSTIVDEAVLYIKNLQQTVENLEKQKQEKLNGGNNGKTTGCDFVAQSREAFLAEQGSTSSQPPVTVASPNAVFPGRAIAFRTWTSPNVVLNVCGIDAHINVVCCPTKPGILTTLLFVLDKFKLDLVSAHVSSDPTTRIYMIHARANGVPQQFPEASFLVEETYKQAAADLMLWINS